MAQRKRAGLITRRTLDRNQAQLFFVLLFFSCALPRWKERLNNAVAKANSEGSRGVDLSKYDPFTSDHTHMIKKKTIYTYRLLKTSELIFFQLPQWELPQWELNSPVDPKMNVLTRPRLELGTFCVLDRCDNQLHHPACFLSLMG